MSDFVSFSLSLFFFFFINSPFLATFDHHIIPGNDLRISPQQQIEGRVVSCRAVVVQPIGMLMHISFSSFFFSPVPREKKKKKIAMPMSDVITKRDRKPPSPFLNPFFSFLLCLPYWMNLAWLVLAYLVGDVNAMHLLGIVPIKEKYELRPKPRPSSFLLFNRGTRKQQQQPPTTPH